MTTFARDIVIVGGCGRVGLPLGLAFADRGLTVALYDVNGAAVERVASGDMPFRESGADQTLPRLVESGRLSATRDASVIQDSEHILVTVATDIDEHMNPDPRRFLETIDGLKKWFRNGQLLVLRSTVYPGLTAIVEEFLAQNSLAIDVAFCPERIAEGHALKELAELPQIIGARTETASTRAEKLFLQLVPDVQHLSPEEAELAKLFTNAWRYVKFAIANQLYMIANDFGVDYEKIRQAIAYRYPRAADLPGAGFAAGPCLLKDTMQLAAFNNNNFTLGHASMVINEGLPLYLVARLSHQYDLSRMTIGILGMAFKGGSDDTRASLSYKLKRILKMRAGEVLCTDPLVASDPELTPLEEVLERSDLLIIAAPHEAYAAIDDRVPVIDIWNLRRRGVLV